MMNTNSHLTLDQTAELDLLAALIRADGIQIDGPLSDTTVTVMDQPSARIAHPWSNIEGDAFLEAIDATDVFEDWSDDEISGRADGFFAHLNQLWPKSLRETLVDRFSCRLPHALLSTIANRAEAVIQSSMSLADQLVHCVDEMVPSLAVEDLQLLARPLAYAMRDASGRDPWETLLSNVRSAEWDALSDVEQARLSLAIARYALSELEDR